VRARPGAQVDQPALRARVREALLRGRPDELRAPTTKIPPATRRADVDALVKRARRAVSAPVVLRRRDTEVTLTPRQLGRVLRVERVEGDGGGVRLRLRADPRRLEKAIGARAIAAVQRRPAPATFAVRGRRVRVVPGSNGFRFVPRRAADQVLSLAATPGSRRASLRGKVMRPERTTADLRDLGIRRRVSTFTTHHDCCESRVENIHRMADIVDGAIVEPGEELELNAYVGPRTTENGFVSAPAILEGKFIQDVGGGVSQFATTFFNAAFFGGYEIVEHKPHSYYISRYPMGREATIDYPYVDLRIRNDSPHGLLVKTSYTDTSITVSFYGRKWVDVSTTTSEPSNIVPGDITDGFDVTVTRALRYRRGGAERESYFTRYLPENNEATS
ncbi:MAG: VanW family protein, partial [Actinomycetota bacterium]|nr:VanW family protein [Actinomycetota bacterium]